ncbi:hypothetical protein PVAP13_2NG441800 [Panicum virgatum]|uniref:Uncharacterized protein n=1 Tax=Panicum virgatum TaxID=38727 RepID=A0A8T0VHQ6_PANVG|nr:hypothetical protein PVAP13_2NG441800 [Panicum virgatum]
MSSHPEPRSPNPASSMFRWSSPLASPVPSALHNIAHCMVVGTSPYYPGENIPADVLMLIPLAV